MKFYSLLFLGISLFTVLLMCSINVGYASTLTVNSSGVTANTTIVDSEGIVPINVHTEPSIIHVGDRFNIHASIVNYSPMTAIIPDGGCSPTGLMATFDGNVAVEQGAEFAVCYQNTLTPAKTLATSAGWPSENYTAISPGQTNATLHLSYRTISDDNQTQMRTYDQDFRFYIVPNLMDTDSKKQVQAFIHSVQTGCEGPEGCKEK